MDEVCRIHKEQLDFASHSFYHKRVKSSIVEISLELRIEAYKGYVAAGKDEEFGRRMLNLTFDEPPYYACKLTAHVQGTFGGIVTDPACEVTNEQGEPIPGLFAAGECAYVGINGANPMSVNIVFGTIARENAAAYSK